MSHEPFEEECAYLEALNPKQMEAVLHFGSPLLILAGAGSGKTRVITTKIAYLVDQKGIDPASILAVAFTNKASDEMKDRVLSLTPAAGGVMIKTFHAFGAWLLRRNTHLTDMPNHFTIYDEDDSLALLKTVLEKKLPLSQLKEAANRISRAKDRCLLPGDDLDKARFEKKFTGVYFSDIYRLYQERLRQTGNADFGDLILLSVKLLQDVPEVKERIRQRFRIILVDEYQDSNFAQFKLLQELYDPDNYLCVVGDEDQSIYGFRGAEVNNILEFPEKFKDTTVIRLEENYRSTRNILEVATRVVENNVHRLGKTLWTRKPAGTPVVLALLEDQDNEAQFCADLLKDGNYGNTAILYRMNFQSRVFETLFARLNIPFRVVGTVRFYEREEIKDALAYLALLVNPKDEIAFRRAINRPRRGVGAKSVQKIFEAGKSAHGDMLEACRICSLSGKSASGVQAFLSLMESFDKKLKYLSLTGVVKYIIQKTGLYNHYLERDEIEGTGRVKNLQELVNAIVEYSGGREGLSLFLEGIGLNSSEENPFRQSNKVTLITVHNTKGLEFDRVFITGLEDGIFPHYSSMLQGLPVAGEDLEEERRLFYVGVTRARETLYLTAGRKRRVFGSLKVSEPSQFLKEIPRDSLHIYEKIAEDDRFPLGCGVYHEDYGPGIITRKWVQEGEPGVIVRFDSGRIARFLLRYAPLERISLDP